MGNGNEASSADGRALVAYVRADGYRNVIAALLDNGGDEAARSRAMLEIEVLDGLTEGGALEIMRRVDGIGRELLRDCTPEECYFAICGGGLVTA